MSDRTDKCIQCHGETYPDAQLCYACKEKTHNRQAGIRYARLTPLPSAVFWKNGSPLAVFSNLLEVSHGHSYYWIVKGPVPLAVAQVLYADPAGRDLIRVDGHCGCPPPEAPWVNWRLPSGRKVLRVKERIECEGYLTSDSTHLARVARKILDTHDFSDDPAGAGAAGFIDLYHIDGDLGLRVFVDIVRAEMPLVTADAEVVGA